MAAPQLFAPLEKYHAGMNSMNSMQTSAFAISKCTNFSDGNALVK